MKHLFIMLFLSVTLSSFGQTAIFSSNFEDQNTDAEIGGEKVEIYEGDTMFVVPNPYSDEVNSSDYVLKLRTNEGSRNRAEYSVERHETNEKKYIYTWKTYFPMDMFTDIEAGSFLINQWKTWPCEAIPDNEPYLKYDTLICEGGGIFNELHYTYPDEISYRSRAWPNCNADYYNLPMGQWNKFTLEIYWTNTDDGYYRIWRNDTLFGFSDNIKTLFDEFMEGTCDVYWSTGLYVGWNKTGDETQEYLSAYIDDVALYDSDSGYSVSSICPDCEDIPTIPTDSNVYKLNINVNAYARDGYNNWITSYSGDTSAIDISNTFGQNNDIDVYLWSNAGAGGGSSDNACFPEYVISTGINWGDTAIRKLYLKDLNPANTYTVKVLCATSQSGSFRGTQIWTTDENRDTILASDNACNMAVLANLVPEGNGDLIIYVKSIHDGTPRPCMNSIELVEYVDPSSGIEKTFSNSSVIYPNPSSGSFTIKLENRMKNTTVAIYSVSGSRVYAENFVNKTEIEVDMSNYKNGIYFVLITNTDSVESYKLIKQ